jgi:hypothetical protein
VINFPGRASSEVRIGRLARAAESLNLATVRRTAGRDAMSGADATRYDALVVQRDAVAPADAEPLIDRLRARGTRLVVEHDDDLVTGPARARLVAEGYDPDRLDALRLLLAAADSVVVSTPLLAERLAAALDGLHPHVVLNRLDPRLWSVRAKTAVRAEERRPVYVGTRTDAGDLELIAKLPDALSDLLGRRQRIDVVGVTDGALPSGFDRIEAPSTLYSQFVRWLRTQRHRWNLGLAPLADSELNESKSDLKLLEYAALQLPAVASDRGPYRSAAGLATLVDDHVTTWAKSVAELIEDPERALEATSQAYELVRSERWLDEAAVRHWIDVILEGADPLAGGQRPHDSAPAGDAP